MGYMPGLQSFEGLTEAGGFSSQMTHSPSCWQETSVLCHTDFFVRLYEERRGGKGGGAGRGDEELNFKMTHQNHVEVLRLLRTSKP
ncbi:uncharacterized protein [Macaca nemestrina]|uniref:uncharacterized protein isoform X2 n=1 Tax=Macaca nemestrina TaxID=9545 RepID=UPI0039B9C463